MEHEQRKDVAAPDVPAEGVGRTAAPAALSLLAAIGAGPGGLSHRLRDRLPSLH